jgi:acetyl-CoA synthetase
MSNEVLHIKNNAALPILPEWENRALITKDTRNQIFSESGTQSDAFWAEKAKRLHWVKKFQTVSKVNFNKPVNVSWFLGGKLNVAYNCIDRHLEANGEKTAFVWVPENLNEKARHITYNELSEKVNRLASALKIQGVKKGDRVTIYMPMIPEATYALLACARIGAIHSVIFGGFSPTSIADRIYDCESEFVITADEGYRGGKTIPLKSNVDAAIKILETKNNRENSINDKIVSVKKVIVVRRTGGNVDWNNSRDVWYHEATSTASPICEPEVMDSEDPLFILYTSGSTGKPKGVLHATGGYLVFASLTHEMVFDYHPKDIYWCAADIGWVTGHSYIVYGPLANCATSIMYEGLPNYPTPSRIWQIIDEHKVNILYTAPTLIRTLMREGETWVKNTSRKSLKVLGSVGEPINPEAWRWYFEEVGNGSCPIVDTWWQTETGGILISPLPGATPLKPGSATFPLFDIKPQLLKDDGTIIEGAGTGHLCFAASWPGQMKTVYKDHARFENTYFSQFPGRYYAGDECHRDEDGYYWIIGRADDVINVSGHRLGTAEVESALVSNHHVAESAVVGYPHTIKGQGLYAFVTLKNGITPSEELKKELIKHVRTEIGPLATPDFIQWAPALPKTRSGKIMRRILKKIAANDFTNLGDTSTLADPSVVDALVENRLNK